MVYFLCGSSKKLSPMNVKLCEDVYDHMALLWSKKQKSQIKKKKHENIYWESSELGTLVLNFLQLLKSTRQSSNIETKYKGKDAS